MKQRPSVNIERLNLRLPQGFENRANGIARETARQMARLPLSDGATLSALSVPSVTIRGAESDKAIAKQIAQSLHGQLRKLQSNGR